MLKVCLDSNVLVSGLVFGGQPGKIVDQALIGKNWRLVTSQHILDEVERNTIKCGVSRWKVRRLVQRLADAAEFSTPKGQLKLPSLEPGDLLVLETAWLTRARYLITGDKAFLALGHYKYTRVIEPKHFLALVA